MCFCVSVFVTLAHIASNLKSLNHESNDKEKIGPTKNPREKNSDSRNTHEKKISGPRIPARKFWTREIPTETRWHDGTKLMKSKIARDPRNLAHSLLTKQTIRTNWHLKKHY